MLHTLQEETRSFSPSVYLHQREVLSLKGKNLYHVIIAWFSYAPSVCERASILLISGADWQCSYVCCLCMSERSALTWICRCCRLETEVLTWSDFGWAGNLLLYVESAIRSKLAQFWKRNSVSWSNNWSSWKRDSAQLPRGRIHGFFHMWKTPSPGVPTTIEKAVDVKTAFPYFPSKTCTLEKWDMNQKKVSSKEASHLCDFLSLIHRWGQMKDSTPAKDYIQLLN